MARRLVDRFRDFLLPDPDPGRRRDLPRSRPRRDHRCEGNRWLTPELRERIAGTYAVRGFRWMAGTLRQFAREGVVRSLARGAACGAALGALLGLVAGCEHGESYLALGAYGASFGCILGPWLAGSAGRPGRGGRLGRLLVAGVLLAFVELTGWAWVEDFGSHPVPSLEALPFVAVALLAAGGVPALLLGAWAERASLRAGRVWWLGRATVSWLFGMFLMTTVTLFAVELFAIGHPHVRWEFPIHIFFPLLLSVGPFGVSTCVLLGIAVAFDRRWNPAGPPGAGNAAAGASAPRPRPAPPGTPGFHPALGTR